MRLAILCALLISGCGSDCRSFAADAAAFRDATNQDTRLDAAETLVTCGHLTGQTFDQIVDALNTRPDYIGTDGNPRRHREIAYEVGYDEHAASDGEISLFMEFERGRVVYAAISGPGDGRPTDGEPVGGGPKFE